MFQEQSASLVVSLDKTSDFTLARPACTHENFNFEVACRARYDYIFISYNSPHVRGLEIVTECGSSLSTRLQTSFVCKYCAVPGEIQKS